MVIGVVLVSKLVNIQIGYGIDHYNPGKSEVVVVVFNNRLQIVISEYSICHVDGDLYYKQHPFIWRRKFQS